MRVYCRDRELTREKRTSRGSKDWILVSIIVKFTKNEVSDKKVEIVESAINDDIQREVNL